MLLILILLLPLAGAMIVRLSHRRWEAWISWGFASLIAFLAIWLSKYLPAGQAALAVAGASFLGFIAPKL